MKIFSVLPFDTLINKVIQTKYYFSEFKIPQVKPRKLRFSELFKIPKANSQYGNIVRQHYVPAQLIKIPKDILELTSPQEIF